MALLFGSKSTCKFIKKAAKFGGTVAIGGIAYTAFTQRQASQRQAQSAVAHDAGKLANVTMLGSTSGLQLDLSQFEPGKPIADLDELAANVRSESIVQAMMSAARSDGHIDDEEMQLIQQQIDNLGVEKDVSQFLMAELNKPVDVNSIAALADTPETAAELYVASALVVDIDCPVDRQYLNKLAEAQNLDAQMVANLEVPLHG